MSAALLIFVYSVTLSGAVFLYIYCKGGEG